MLLSKQQVLFDQTLIQILIFLIQLANFIFLNSKFLTQPPRLFLFLHLNIFLIYTSLGSN